jgi:hypothetical protein
MKRWNKTSKTVNRFQVKLLNEELEFFYFFWGGGLGNWARVDHVGPVQGHPGRAVTPEPILGPLVWASRPNTT